MARLPRLSIAGQVHLLMQRGRSGQPVFTSPQDAQSYLAALRAAADQAGVAVHAYALSAGEALMLVTPLAAADSLSRMVQSLGRRFVGDYNQRHAASGSPWEGRFRSTVIDSTQHLLSCLCFVESMDSGAAADQAWSSASHHGGSATRPVDHRAPWILAPGQHAVRARGGAPPTAVQRQHTAADAGNTRRPSQRLAAGRFGVHGVVEPAHDAQNPAVETRPSGRKFSGASLTLSPHKFQIHTCQQNSSQTLFKRT